jgi:AhpD family alkylhydroperoxidase
MNNNNPGDTIMETRLNHTKASPESYKAILALEAFVQNCGLERRFIHLIKLRASIINSCAYCVDMHTKESRRDGLSEQWINLMSVWRESTVYTAQERALLGWVDTVTKIAETGAPDSDFAVLKEHFTEEDIVKITLAIGTINTWNRIAVGFRMHHPVDAAAKAA